MLSGQFSREGLDAECPGGFHKVCEGSAAVLFPPAMVRGTRDSNGAAADHNAEAGDEDDQAVFYNPAQVVNRDLSVCTIQLFANLRKSEPRRKGGTAENGITILEALSATGLRAIRYFKEIEGVRYIIANDLDSDAVDCIRRNCAYNGIPSFAPGIYENFPTAAHPENTFVNGSGSYDMHKAGIVPNLDDAIDLMHRLEMNETVHHYADKAGDGPSSSQEKENKLSKRLVLLNDGPSGVNAVTHASQANVQGVLQQELMDVVDLDPYGTASPFLDAAFGCIKEGGLMLVTSTDSAILCGNYPDTCHAKYNAVPHKGSHCHEMAVRILLGCMERAANKKKKYIVPLLSMHIDFYVRCFVRVYTQPAEVKLSPCKLGYQLQCTHCPAFWVRPMTTAVTRRTKAERRAAMATADGAKNGVNRKAQKRERELENHSSAAGPVPMSDGTMESSAPPAERYPAIPSRQENPRLQCLTFHRFPAMHYNPTTGKVEEHTGQGTHTDRTEPARNGHGSCPVCGVGAIALSGPIYAAPTQNREYLEQLLTLIQERDTAGRITATARIRGLVQVALEELDDCPLFFNLPDVASYVRSRCPPTPQFVAALGRLGYRCSQVHCCAAGLKTDCPPEVLFSVMLSYKEKEHGTEEAQGDAGKAGEGKRPRAPPPALCVGPFKPAELVDFTYDPRLDFRGKATGQAKFVPNAPGWGPKRRHQGALRDGTEEA